ncbi:unnamed protein product [Pedinophyceae sp. YPF-701]|nr:unnamed protein product [Pedinophyceae sp. YPF-701]
MGDRTALFRAALAALEARGVRPVRFSSLYESSAWVVTDQPDFLNAAVRVETDRSPHQLLQACKDVEETLGRLEGERVWGPRPIDLDIILFGGQKIAEERKDAWLQIPHPLWTERSFVWRPVADLHDERDLAHATSMPVEKRLLLTAIQHAHERARRADAASAQAPAPLVAAAARVEAAAGHGHRASAAEAVSELLDADGLHPPRKELRRVLPAPGVRGGVWEWEGRTRIMGVLNATPDSFSDGGLHASAADAAAAATDMINNGADIIDIGGQSTRPGAERVSAEEEAQRVVPAIAAVAKLCRESNTLLSVDTFYASVAKAAVAAGASCVNDVSSGSIDPDMLKTVAELGVPYVAMHMRGGPQTMQLDANTTYAVPPGGSIADAVGAELNARCEAAVAAGIEPWRIVLDPGLGFAKTPRGSIQLLGGLPRLRRAMVGGCLQRAPLLVGMSRKGFLGEVAGRRVPAERDWATAGAAAAAVRLGADIVRVHNVPGVRDAVRVADVLHRGFPADAATA